MPIVCPHCATSYAVDPATLGSGRNVRCARCKEVWRAEPQTSLLALVATAHDAADSELPTVAESGVHPIEIAGEPPRVESPSLAADMPFAERRGLVPANDAGPATIEGKAFETPAAPIPRKPARRKAPLSILPTAAVAMGAFIAALIVWRAEMVRLMPQTAGFYRIIGLDVNLRGLWFRDVRLKTDDIEGKPVLLVEGMVESRRAATVELPRLRFVVRNSAGTEIYGWNAKLDTAVLKPGETVAFRSQLASPPADAHSIDVRFLHRRDLATGAA